MGAVKALGELKNVHVEIVSFPEDIFIEAHDIHGFSYRIMGAMHHLAIHRARAVGGAHIIFLFARRVIREHGLDATAGARASSRAGDAALHALRRRRAHLLSEGLHFFS